VKWEAPIEDERINTTASSSARTTLYLHRLDPQVAHTLSLQADGAVGLESVAFYSARSMPPANMYVHPLRLC
jgi:hypothetical protein